MIYFMIAFVSNFLGAFLAVYQQIVLMNQTEM